MLDALFDLGVVIDQTDHLSDRESDRWLVTDMLLHEMLFSIAGGHWNVSPIGGGSEEDNEIYLRTTPMRRIGSGGRVTSALCFRRTRSCRTTGIGCGGWSEDGALCGQAEACPTCADAHTCRWLARAEARATRPDGRGRQVGVRIQDGGTSIVARAAPHPSSLPAGAGGG